MTSRYMTHRANWACFAYVLAHPMSYIKQQLLLHVRDLVILSIMCVL